MATDPDDQLALIRRLKIQNQTLAEQIGNLKGGVGGGTFDAMVPIKDYVDKADEAVETRLTAKLDKLAHQRYGLGRGRYRPWHSACRSCACNKPF